MAWVLLAVAGVLLVDLAIRFFYVRLIIPQFEATPPFNVAPHPPDPMAERVTTVTADGVVLRGSLHRGVHHQPRGLVLFCPELDGTHWSASWYCEALLHHGFDVLSFDFRGQGDSDPMPGYTPNHWPTHLELTDVRAALQFIRTRDDLRDLPLTMMGVSRGSLVALYATAECPQVQAFCGEGTYTVDSLLEHFARRWAQLYLPAWALKIIPMWHLRMTLRMVRWASQWRRGVRYAIVEPLLRKLRDRPVLLISGERDNYVQPSIVRGIARRIGSRLCRVWSVPRAKHNQARDVARDDYDQAIVEFFSATCPAPAPRAQRPAATTAVT